MKTLICLLAVLCMAGGSLWAQPVINATQTDALIIDNGNSGLADPNDRIRYKATIQNTGTTPANGVQLNAAPDANTTFVSNSFVTTPVAANDAYTCTGNVGISVPAGSGVKANDYDDALASATLSVITNPTSGSVTLNNDGSFTYTPNAGFTGSDQFTYGINDATPIAGTTPANADIRATVTITVSDMIWFVDNTGGGTGGTGTLANPFKTLANFNGSAGPQAGHVVFVKHTGTTYRGGIVLKNNMYLFGSGHTGGSNLADAGVLPFTIAANSPALPAINGTRTIIINDIHSGVSPFYGITLASGNTIRGINVGRCESSKIYGNNFGTLTIGNTTSPDVELSGNQYALDLTNGTFAATSKLASINSPDSSRILLNTVSGSLASASTAVNASGSGGSVTVNIQNSSAALDFGNTTVNNYNGGTCISITNSGTGSVTFSNLSMPYAGNGIGLVASTGGTINIGGTGSSITARTALDITSTSFGSGATFASITSNNFSSKAVNLDNVSGPLTINGGSISASTLFAGGVAFDVNGGSSNITYAGSITYPSPSTDRVVEVTGRTGGTVTFSGTIDATSGTGINVASNTGGTINFSGSTKTLNTGANTAVTLSSNSGATINFTGGGLDIDCTSATAFNATGGATAITVQGTGNTITSTTGTALNVANTTIGASGLTFQSISSNGGSATGIILDNTGSSGGLTVTGTGSAGSGGTIASKTGSNGSTTTGVGIYLNNCANISLTGMQLNDFSNFGIRGFEVNNFTMDNCVVNHSSGKNGDDAATDEGSIYFGAENPSGINGLTGTVNITNCLIEDGYENNFKIANLSGTLSQLTMTGCTIRDNSTASPGNNGFEIRAQGTANITADITTSTFTGNRANGIQVTTTTEHTGTVDVEIGTSGVAGSGGTFTNNNIGVNIGHGSAGTLNFDIHRGTFNSNPGLASPININLAAGGGGPMSGSITNNAITNANSSTGPGMRIISNGTDGDGSNVLTVLVSNNNISQIANRGIEVIARDGNSTINAIVTNNTVSLTDALSADAIRVDAGATSTDVTTVNAHISGNNATTISGSFGVRVRQRFTGTTFRLQGYGGSATDMNAVQSFLSANNNGATTSADFAGAGFLNIVTVPSP